MLYNNSMISDKIQSIGCNLENPRLIQTLEQIASLPQLVKPLICLPDIHLKEKTEAPCSFVTATEHYIIPELTAPSVGCGMGIIATSLTHKDITPEKLEIFYGHMREHLGPRYGLLENVLLWIGLLKRPLQKYDLREQELVEAIEHGAAAAQKKYNLPQDILDHIEYNGNAMDEETRRAFPARHLLPRAAFATGRHDMGYGFKGNHFLEIQYIETIADEQIARSWGLTPGQIVIMYHGGGGAVSYYMGRYFANRKKDRNKFRSRVFQMFGKFLFHFGSWEGLQHAYERWRYYFSPRPFEAIPINTFEGKRLMASVKASLNYSYAFRLAIVKRVMDAFTKTFGPEVKASLLWDNIHNSIREENIGNRKLIVHRHTATRAFEGYPVLVSGFNNTSSYIGIGLPKGEEHLFSVDHGAGETIKKHRTNGISQIHPEQHETEIHTTKHPYKEKVPHITNEGLEAVVKPLEAVGLMRAVAYTRPIAVFKG